MLSRRDQGFFDFPGLEDFGQDRYFGDALRRFGDVVPKNLDQRFSQQLQTIAPRTDISETPECLKITSEMPGLKKEDLNIELDESGKFLTLSGETKQENKEEKENFHKVERSYGKFQRTFRMPENAKTEQIKANLDHGVLKVIIPKDVSKSQQQQSKRINIQ